MPAYDGVVVSDLLVDCFATRVTRCKTGRHTVPVLVEFPVLPACRPCEMLNSGVERENTLKRFAGVVASLVRQRCSPQVTPPCGADDMELPARGDTVATFQRGYSRTHGPS